MDGQKETVEIHKLNHTDLSLKRPISVCVEDWEDCYVAFQDDTELLAYNATKEEAIHDITDIIGDVYFLLKQEQYNLGPLPQKQWNFLQEVIVDKEQSIADRLKKKGFKEHSNTPHKQASIGEVQFLSGLKEVEITPEQMTLQQVAYVYGTDHPAAKSYNKIAHAIRMLSLCSWWEIFRKRSLKNLLIKEIKKIDNAAPFDKAVVDLNENKAHYFRK